MSPAVVAMEAPAAGDSAGREIQPARAHQALIAGGLLVDCGEGVLDEYTFAHLCCSMPAQITGKGVFPIYLT